MTMQKTRATQLSGLRSAQPAATAVAEGSLYFVTDESLVERSTGAAWVAVMNANAGLITSRAIPYSGNSAVYPTAAAMAFDPNKLSFRSDTLRFGVNCANGNALYPADIQGSPVDIGYMIRSRPASTGSAYIQMGCSGANDSAGFAFNQLTNGVEWRMAVIGNEANALRWTAITSSGAVTTYILFVTTGGNFILDTARNDVTTGTKCFVFGNGTAPTAAAANTSALFAQDDAASSELCVINEADEITQLSGHMTLAVAKLLRFGGSTSSFPALKRSTVVLQTKLADDSAFAQHSALEFMNNSANFLMRTAVAWTDGAAAQVGTLTNAPAAGNPTKWIPVDDNGTTRYVPAW